MMNPGILNLIVRSVKFYKRSLFYQASIVFILAAIISGSLLTGFSVRQSLKNTAWEHLGKTDLLISSGQRYFNADLSEKISFNSGEKCTSVLEVNGYCQNFATGTIALNTKIWGITKDFFTFNGNDTLIIAPGSVAVNQNLAQFLGLKTGDDIIINYKEITPFPSNAPFAPEKTLGGSKVLKVSQILKPEQSGNFALGISQIVPMNIFMNLAEMTNTSDYSHKANRILVANLKNIPPATFLNILMKSVSPSDIGLSVRHSNPEIGPEIISERIFIDQEIIDEIGFALHSARPVITYLANSIRKDDKTTPYSFVSAVPPDLYPGILTGNNIVINDWLAKDLGAVVHDTINLTWFSPSANGILEEKSNNFIISRIVNINTIWDDASLMPEFPGISGRTSCSSWDAGGQVNLKSIRKKDEDYWNKFKGCPKAFISYSKGQELWGSNFGPATSIRFPVALSREMIEKSLTGSLHPERTGFSINNIRTDALKAAADSVDFSSLFLSLSFFIILSCIILLALSVSLFFDSKKNQVFTFYALGFSDKWIVKLLFLETSAIAITGALPGAFAGSFINILIIMALNSVWSGAVQTNTLSAHLDLMPLITAFLITILISVILLRIKAVNFLKNLKKSEKGLFNIHSNNKNLLLFFLFLVTSLLLITLSILFRRFSVPLSFAGGASLFLTLIFLVRQYFLGGFRRDSRQLINSNVLSRLYYSINPSHAVTPAIFIAAGIFAVFITGANKMNINDSMKTPSGGTGGYTLWCESVVPVKLNLNTPAGRKEFGLDEQNIKDIRFVQAKRSQGDDASCLNLNHIAAPPLLGLDPSDFIRRGSFSFSTTMQGTGKINPWELLQKPANNMTIYGIADQTVLQWGLKMATGDTIKLKAESGQTINIIIAAGLKSSLFQGYVIIGSSNFDKFYPSVPGSSLFLASTNPELTDISRKILKERFANYGFSIVPAHDRLASFFQVTNTYLSVFTVLGAFGMLLGVAGMGFILMRNYNYRKKEFLLMAATGYSPGRIRRMVFFEQLEIISAGILSGILSALVATLPSLTGVSIVPWRLLLLIIVMVFITGLIAIAASVRVISNESLMSVLRKE